MRPAASRTEPNSTAEPNRFAIDRLQLLEYEYRTALSDLEKEQISFNVLSDVCLPVSLLLLIVIWGYQLNAMTVDPDSGEDHTMLLFYGIGLIVISGSACVYIAIRMSVMKPEKINTFFPGEIKPLHTEQKRSQKFYYQTIPEIHRVGKKSTDIFIV
ncbi:uncharacterized protein LOC112692080 [Sipha flava]|uniref:Uncharacterized protein LOC112692080 n=1 Tax=Sipha flava TaxID=143950 RepID=A0A2S2PVM7_9HEMI|nr:uncharacterized protein LOC112692080 [Sipha flava]